MHYYNNLLSQKKAVALGFDKDKANVPKVLASGKGRIAQQIIKIADEHNIPLYQDSDLVALLSSLDINEYIPIEVYSVVAKIFTYIYDQEKKDISKKVP
jgi:flagellar biosynthesis protein